MKNLDRGLGSVIRSTAPLQQIEYGVHRALVLMLEDIEQLHILST